MTILDGSLHKLPQKMALRWRCQQFALLVGIVLFLTSGQLLAAGNTGWYGGIGIGSASADVSAGQLVNGVCQNCSVDDGNDALQAFVGWRWSPLWSLELGYTDFNQLFSLRDEVESAAVSVTQDTYGFYLSGKAHWPISDRLEVFAKLGSVFWNSDIRYRVNGQSLQNADSSTDLTYAVGAAFALGRRVSLGLEWSQYQSLGDSDIALVSPDKTETVAVDTSLWTLFGRVDFEGLF